MTVSYDPDLDFYKALSLKSPTTSAAVRVALLKALEKLRPGDSALRHFLQQAALVLGDAVQRAEYDKLREKHLREVAEAPPISGAKITNYQAASPAGIALAEEAVQNAPEDMDALEWLAFQYYSSSNLEGAIKAYTKLLVKRPDDAGAHYYLARAYQRTERIPEAVKHWRRVVEIEPDSEQGLRAADAIKKFAGS